MDRSQDDLGSSAELGRLTPERVLLLRALLARETFTYADIALLSGKTEGAVRTTMHRLAQSGAHLLEPVSKQKRGAGRAGRYLDVWKLAPGVREKLVLTLSQAETKETQTPRRRIEKFNMLDEARNFISAAETEDDPLSQRQKRCNHARHLLDRAKTVAADWEHSKEIEISEELRGTLVAIVDEIGRLEGRILKRLDESAESSEHYATLALEDIQQGRREEIESRFEHLDALASREHNAGNRHAALFVSVIVAQGMMGSYTSINEIAGEYTKKPEFACAVRDAALEALQRATTCDSWRDLTEKVIAGVSTPPFVRLAGMLETLERIATLKETEDSVKDLAIQTLDVHSPRGSGRGLCDDEIIIELVESL